MKIRFNFPVVGQIPLCPAADLPQTLERRQRGQLAAARRFPYLADIGYMKVVNFARGLEAENGRLVRHQLLADLCHRLAGPTVGVVEAFRLIRTRYAPV